MRASISSAVDGVVHARTLVFYHVTDGDKGCGKM